MVKSTTFFSSNFGMFLSNFGIFLSSPHFPNKRIPIAKSVRKYILLNKFWFLKRAKLWSTRIIFNAMIAKITSEENPKNSQEATWRKHPILAIYIPNPLVSTHLHTHQSFEKHTPKHLL